MRVRAHARTLKVWYLALCKAAIPAQIKERMDILVLQWGSSSPISLVMPLTERLSVKLNYFCKTKLKTCVNLSVVQGQTALHINNQVQGRNHWKMLAATSSIMGRICPLGWDRVKVSENLGVTTVVPVAPVVISLPYHDLSFLYKFA